MIRIDSKSFSGFNPIPVGFIEVSFRSGSRICSKFWKPLQNAWFSKSDNGNRFHYEFRLKINGKLFEIKKLQFLGWWKDLKKRSRFWPHPPPPTGMGTAGAGIKRWKSILLLFDAVHFNPCLLLPPFCTGPVRTFLELTRWSCSQRVFQFVFNLYIFSPKKLPIHSGTSYWIQRIF